MVTPDEWNVFGMVTTSLKLPDDVKQLVAEAASRQGITPHAFMVDAVATAAMDARKRAEFVADAVAARQQALRTGHGYAAKGVHVWLHAKANGRTAHKPGATKWRK